MIRWITTHLWLLVFVAIIIGLSIPSFGLVFKPYLLYMLMGLMFFSLMGVRIRQVVKELKNYRREFIILVIIHLCSPLIILLFKPFFSEELFLGLIISAVISSAVSSVFLSQLYGGKPSEALVITTVSNALSPIIIPLLVLLFARTSIEVDTIAMFFTVLQVVIIPFILAIIARKAHFEESCKKFGPTISITLLFFIIIGVVAPVQESIVTNTFQAVRIGLFVGMLIFINAFLGWIIGKNRKEKITFAITASYKNYTLSTVIALSLFSPLIALPAVMYVIMNNLFLIPLQFFLKK